MMRLVFAKSHVKGHYRTDPTTHEQVYVKPHEDERKASSEPFRMWRVQGGTIRHAAPGQSISPQQAEQLISSMKRAGLNGQFIHGRKGSSWNIYVSGVSRRELDSFWRKHGSAAIRADNQEKIKADAQARKDHHKRELSEGLDKVGPAATWIAETFGIHAMNDYNRLQLAKYLAGEEKKFNGLANNSWSEGLDKLGALADNRIDFEKIKSAFESQSQGESPAGTVKLAVRDNPREGVRKLLVTYRKEIDHIREMAGAGIFSAARHNLEAMRKQVEDDRDEGRLTMPEYASIKEPLEGLHASLDRPQEKRSREPWDMDLPEYLSHHMGSAGIPITKRTKYNKEVDRAKEVHRTHVLEALNDRKPVRSSVLAMHGLAKEAEAMRAKQEAESQESNSLIPQGQMNLFKSIRSKLALWFGKTFAKSHVKQYTRSDGTIVREHDDKRLKKPGEAKNPRPAAKDKPKKGKRPAKQEETPQPHVTDQPEYPKVEAAKPGELAAWLENIMNEPDIVAASEEVRATTPTDKIYKNQETGEYTPDRAKIHEAIVASMLNPKAVPEEGQNPHAMIFMGRPASGKTSALQPAAKELGVEFTVINADDVKEKLPEYNGRNAGVVHEESSDIAEKQLFRKALESGHHVLLDVTGGNVKKLQKWVEDFHALGYEISIMMAELPLEECCARAVNRFRHTGRFVPPNYIANDVDHKPEKTYDVLKNDPRVSHWRRYSTDVKKGEQAPLREQGSKDASAGNPFNKGGSFEASESFLGRSNGEDVQRNGRESKRSNLRHAGRIQEVQDHHASVVPPALARAYGVRDALVKSIHHYSIDLTSPEVAPDVRGTILAARHRQQTRLEQLNDMIAKVEA